jgi:DNA repair protein RecO (recombination protein O)
MPPIASDALVLRTYALGETSKVVVLLTRERGKARAVAKGARGRRSRYRSALEPLSEVRVGLHGRQGAELFRLGDCELIRSAHRAGRLGLDPSLALSYCAELLESFAQEGQAEDAVYRLGVAAVEAIERGQASDTVTRYLEAWLLKLGGVYPPLDRCASCEAALGGGAREYHEPSHGFVCADCLPASGPLLSTAAVTFVAACFRQPPSEIESRPPAELAPFHSRLLRNHLERDLKSPRVIRDVARQR